MNNGLPHNIEAERALIGSVFWSYASLQKVCEEVTSEVFYLDSHSKIFEVIQELYFDKKEDAIKEAKEAVQTTPPVKEEVSVAPAPVPENIVVEAIKQEEPIQNIELEATIKQILTIAGIVVSPASLDAL